MMKIETPYYEDNTRVSNSALGWFIKKGPQYFRNMLDGKEEGIKGSFLERGTMIHMYILQPEEFWDHYMILEFETPKSKQQKDALEYYNNSITVDPMGDQDHMKIEAYRSAYKNKLSDDKCLEGMNNLIELYQDYLEYLSKTENKIAITFADLNMLKTIKSNIENHIAAKELLSDTPGCECHNEFHINWESPDVGFSYITKDNIQLEYKSIPCKSLLDRVKIDHANKRITIIDLKTTSDIYNFKHSVEEFDYYRQIAFYGLAITWYMNDLDIDITDYDFEAYIIAIQTNSNYEVRTFNMCNYNELCDRQELISRTLSEISYHYQTGKWEHTRAYYDNNGIEELK